MAFDLVITLSGLIVGILFGLALQRGRLCFNSAIRDPLIFKDYTLIKAIFMAIAVSMIGFAVLGFTDVVNPSPKPFMPIAQLIGGLVFGMGMVLAAACASGVTYKTGEGIMAAFVGLLGLALGGYTARFGALDGARQFLQGIVNVPNLTFVGVIDPLGDVTIYLAAMLLGGIIFTSLMVWRFMLPSYTEWTTQKQGSFVDIFFKQGWQWWLTGIIVAIINIIAWVTSFYIGGRNYPLGITAGWIGILNSFLLGDVEAIVSFAWLSWVVLGLLIGSFIGAKGAGEYKMAVPQKGRTFMIAFIGGLMLGVGAVFASGCNITNMLSGLPLLSMGSLVFTVFMCLGVWFMAYLLFKVIDFSLD